MASFKSYQDYEEARREWLDVPHAVYIQKTGSCVQMTGNEPLVFNDPTVASIIGTMSYNAVSKIQSLNNRFRNTTIESFKEFRHFKCILDIEEKAFEDCGSLREIYLPPYVYTIGDHAFSHCSSLETIKMRGLVEIIAESAYSNCTLLCNLAVPMSVKAIGDYAFYNCKSLEEIDMMPLLPPYIHGDTIFKGCDCLRAINIWPACISDYINHPVWSKYKSLFRIKEMR